MTPIDGGVRVRVLGAGEVVTITGAAPSPVTATARTSSESRTLDVVARERGRFDVDVTVGPARVDRARTHALLAPRGFPPGCGAMTSRSSCYAAAVARMRSTTSVPSGR